MGEGLLDRQCFPSRNILTLSLSSKGGSNNKCVPSSATELVKFSNKWTWSSAPHVDGLLLLSAAGFTRLFCGRGRDCKTQPHLTKHSLSYFGGLLP